MKTGEVKQEKALKTLKNIIKQEFISVKAKKSVLFNKLYFYENLWKLVRLFSFQVFTWPVFKYKFKTKFQKFWEDIYG